MDKSSNFQPSHPCFFRCYALRQWKQEESAAIIESHQISYHHDSNLWFADILPTKTENTVRNPSERWFCSKYLTLSKHGTCFVSPHRFYHSHIHPIRSPSSSVCPRRNIPRLYPWPPPRWCRTSSSLHSSHHHPLLHWKNTGGFNQPWNRSSAFLFRCPRLGNFQISKLSQMGWKQPYNSRCFATMFFAAPIVSVGSWPLVCCILFEQITPKNCHTTQNLWSAYSWEDHTSYRQIIQNHTWTSPNKMHTSSTWYVPSTPFTYLYIIRACFSPSHLRDLSNKLAHHGLSPQNLLYYHWSPNSPCSPWRRQRLKGCIKKKGLWSWGHFVTSEDQPSLIYTISLLMHKSVYFAKGCLWGIDFEAEANSTQLEPEVSRGHNNGGIRKITKYTCWWSCDIKI